jgi:pimeloyl-ACP methyl ester carboxylesterase
VSSARGLVYDRYYVGAHAEWLMRIGPESGAPILFVPPLFEEMNRTRALIVSVMRILASAGYCCWLPDLPGTGESERALETCSWADWREAVRLAADRVRSGRTLVVASVRGGALLDDIPDATHWRFSPVEGRSLLRDLSRSGLTGGDGAAGYPMSPDLSAGLAAARPAPVPLSRIVRLTADRQSADARVDGPALWRRSEPGTSSELAELISSDISTWASKCAS